MPSPRPRKGEGKDKFVGRAIGFFVGEGKPQDQAVAIANDLWSRRGKMKKSLEEFIKSIPMDWSFKDIMSSVQNAANALLNDPKTGWADIVDIYLDGSCIISTYEGEKSKHYQYDYSFGKDDEVILSNPVEVERTWEEVDKSKKKTISKAAIFKVDEEKGLIYGVVLSPDLEDAQGDIIDRDEIEKATHRFMEDYRNQYSNMGDMHKKITHDVVVVESFIYDSEIYKSVPDGSWVMVSKAKSQEMKDKVKKGEYTGYSIGGRGNRTPIKEEE